MYDLLLYLFEMQNNRVGVTGREKSSSHWFTPQIATTVGVQSRKQARKNQGERNSTQAFHGVEGPKNLDHLMLLSQAS